MRRYCHITYFITVLYLRSTSKNTNVNFMEIPLYGFILAQKQKLSTHLILKAIHLQYNTIKCIDKLEIS